MSTKKILIAFATKGGVTEEAACVIANVLREKHGLQVDVVNLRKNPSPDLTSYTHVFIGSGVRMGKWYKQALKFLENNFEEKNVLLFLSSCTAGDTETHNEAIVKYIDEVLAHYPHVKPIAAGAFGGRMKMLGKTVKDNCDMEKVRAWAEEVGKTLT
jgi:menaquinone-dependent protoporphyrinogen oxidase